MTEKKSKDGSGKEPRQSTRARNAKKVSVPPSAEIPKGKNLTTAQRALRNSYALTRKAQGFTNEEIAEELGLTVSGLRHALRDHRKAMPDLLNMDPLEIVEVLAQGFLASVADLERMAAAYADRHPSAAVGAKKGADEARRRLAELLQATGTLPKKLGTLKHVVDVRAVVVQVLDATDAFVQAADSLELKPAQRRQLEKATGRLREDLKQIAGVQNGG